MKTPRIQRLAAVLLTFTLLTAGLAQPLVRPARFGGGEPDAVSGGTLILGTVDLPTTFNPFTSRILSDAFRINILLPALVSFNGATLEHECYLCLDYEIAEDGLSVTYTIREGAQWSDGEAINAEDVMYSVSLHANPDINSRYVPNFSLSGEPVVWEQVDELTVIQRVPQIDAAVLDLANFPIIPEHVYAPVFAEGGAEAVQELWDVNTPPSELVAGGPFQVAEFNINESLLLTRNPNYFVEDESGTQLPYLDEILIQGAADSNALLASFLAGELDIFTAELIDEVTAIADAIDTGRIDAVLLPNAAFTAVTSTVHPNYQNTDPFLTELFRDVRFRRAISHLIDRQSIIDLAVGGLGVPLYGPFSSGNTRFYNEDAFVEGESKFSFNPEAAAELLAELGFTERNDEGFLVNSDGQTISFNILGNASEPVQRVAGQILSEDMRAAGVDVSVTIADTGSVVAPAMRNFDEDNNRSFDFMFTNFGGVADPPTRRNLYNLNGRSRLWNLPLPGEPRPARVEPFEEDLDALVFEALATFDEAERFEIYTELQRQAAANLPLIYMYTQGLNFAYDPRVGNTQDQLEDPISSFEGSQNGFFGQIINYIDTLYVAE